MHPSTRDYGRAMYIFNYYSNYPVPVKLIITWPFLKSYCSHDKSGNNSSKKSLKIMRTMIEKIIGRLYDSAWVDYALAVFPYKWVIYFSNSKWNFIIFITGTDMMWSKMTPNCLCFIIQYCWNRFNMIRIFVQHSVVVFYWGQSH